MNLPISVTPNELKELLLNIAPIRPVHIWGAPGIGKSAIVEEFSLDVGMDCVSMLGSQLAPEDIIGIPQIKDGKSRFLPPAMIARDEPYVLFLDELNGASLDVQRAMYSLIYEKRVGDFHLPEGSIVIAAGNRAQDNAIVKTMSSALVNRMFQVELKPDPKQWLEWAYENGINPWITEYITQRPDHLFSEPPKVEEPFSTPRSWHMLSDALKEYGAGEKDVDEKILKTLAYGCLSPSHAGMFIAFVKQVKNKYALDAIIKGDEKWPDQPRDRDVLYFLAQSFRARLLHDLPANKGKLDHNTQAFVFRSKSMIKELSEINFEIAQMVVSADEGEVLPEWFMMEVVRDLPRLVK